MKALLGEKQTESAEMKAEVGKMKKSMNFSSVGDIDARIAIKADKVIGGFELQFEPRFECGTCTSGFGNYMGVPFECYRMCC